MRHPLRLSVRTGCARPRAGPGFDVRDDWLMRTSVIDKNDESCREDGEGRLTVVERRGSEALVAQLKDQVGADLGVVFDDEHARHDFTASSSSGSPGRVRQNVVPASEVASSSRSPPWSRRILREIASPSPVPFLPSELYLEKALKISS